MTFIVSKSSQRRIHETVACNQKNENKYMDTIIDLVEKICETYNCPAWVENQFIIFLLLLIFLIWFVKTILSLFKTIIEKLLSGIIAKDLSPYYSVSDVKRATENYIATNYQNIPPSEEDEIGGKYSSSSKSLLIPFFIKKAFKNDKDDNKYYLILSDTGMGKTTFLINLYLAYKKALKRPFYYPKCEIKLFPLSFPNILNDIELIEDKTNTILLLDSFDEDSFANEDYQKRLNEILSKTYKFREIVITCRTHFFPNQLNEPLRTGYFSAGESGEYKFHKLYISPFDEKDINKYVKKKFSIFSYAKRKKAFNIIHKSPNLSARPMLLSRIDDLISEDIVYQFPVQLYKTFIAKWLERESKKPGILKKYKTESRFISLLDNFSRRLAVDIYLNKEERGGYYLPRNSNLDYLKSINQESGSLDLIDLDLEYKSLLNRNAAGDYKFSHKSVLEYYLADYIFKNPLKYKAFDFFEVSASKIFLKQMVTLKLIEEKTGYNASTRRIKNPNNLFKTEIIDIVLYWYFKENVVESWFFMNEILNTKSVEIYFSQLKQDSNKKIFLSDLINEVKTELKKEVKNHQAQIEKKRILDTRAQVDLRRNTINHYEGSIDSINQALKDINLQVKKLDSYLNMDSKSYFVKK